MSSGKPQSSKPAAKPPAKSERSDRLATALRDNLKRRKAQARAREAAGPDGRDSSATPTLSPPKPSSTKR